MADFFMSYTGNPRKIGTPAQADKEKRPAPNLKRALQNGAQPNSLRLENLARLLTFVFLCFFVADSSSRSESL